jgi:hypothetical protein
MDLEKLLEEKRKKLNKQNIIQENKNLTFEELNIMKAESSSTRVTDFPKDLDWFNSKVKHKIIY